MTELRIGSSSIDPIQLRTYRAIVKVASEKQVPFIIIGASARDLVMHYGYGAPVQRATKDIDLAVQVADWENFDSICESLVADGYTRTAIPHRLQDSEGVPLDIIPFGPLEQTGSRIFWPPDGDIKMGVMGFQEAFRHSIWVRVGSAPELKLPVVSPEGLALLKLVAWLERDRSSRRKDATDLAYLAANYENIPGIMETLYERHDAILETYDWDTRLCGAHVLGLEVAFIADLSTMMFLKRSLSEEKVVVLKTEGEHYGGGSQGVISAFQAGLFQG